MNKYKVIIGIPTFNSQNYISKNFETIQKEINLLSNYEVIIFICINGDNFELIKNEINNIKCSYEVRILYEKNSGKNNALNRILKESKKLNFDLIHFIDDDVDFKNGSILKNIECLIEKSKKYKTKYILVGSHFLGRKKTLQEQLNISKTLGIFNYLFQKIIVIPFEKQIENPNFCLGGAVCGFLEIYPFYPNSTTGIADDGYIGNYFLLHSPLTRLGCCPIFKHIDSVMYFNLANNYSEWKLQQIRIFIGVYYSYQYFENSLNLFRDYFSWEYSIEEEFRISFRQKKTLIEIYKVFILRLLQKIILKEATQIIKSKKCPDWNTAITTK